MAKRGFKEIYKDLQSAYVSGTKKQVTPYINELLQLHNLSSSLNKDHFVFLAAMKNNSLNTVLADILRKRKNYEDIYNSFGNANATYRDILFKKAFTKDNVLEDFINNYKSDQPRNLTQKLEWLKTNQIIDFTSIKAGDFAQKLTSLKEAEVKNVLKNLDSLATNNSTYNQFISKVAAEIDAGTLPGTGPTKKGGVPRGLKYNIAGIDDWINNYRLDNYKLLSHQGKSIFSTTSNTELIKAYVKAGLSDSSFATQVVMDISSASLNDTKKLFGSLNTNDTDLVKALHDNSILDIDNAKFLQKDIRNSYIDEVKKVFNDPKAHGKSTIAYKLAKEGYLSKTDTDIFKYVINHKQIQKTGQQNLDTFANLITDQEVKDAFNEEVKNSFVSATDPAAKQRHLDYLTKNNLITAADTQVIENIANNGKGLNAARKALSDPELQKALDNKIYEEYTSNPNWDDIQNSAKARYQYEYLNANAPDRLNSLDTLKKLAADPNGNVDVEAFKKRVEKIQDPGLKAEMEQRIADASDLTKNPIKQGETNPFAEYEFNNDKNYKHRQEYLNSFNADDIVDADGNLKDAWKNKGLTNAEIDSIRARATLNPAVAHPHLEGWKQARQGLAKAFADPGSTNISEIYEGVKQGIFGKPSSSGNSGNVDVSGWKNFVKTGLTGVPVGLGVEYGINSPIREAMGGGNTGNRGLDTLTNTLTDPYTGLINSALVGGGTQGFAEAAGRGLGNRIAAGGVGALKYGFLNPRAIGLAALMAGANQARDAANISSNNAIWQAASSAAPWVQLGGAGTKIFGGNLMALPALTSAATAAVSNAAMNAQTERLGMRDTGRRYAAGADMIGKDIDNYKGYVFLDRNGKAKDIYQIREEMIAKGYSPKDAQDYIDTNYMAYTPEFVKGVMNNHVNKDLDWMRRVEKALTFYDKDGNPTGRISRANETGNHLTDTLDYAQKMVTTSLKNDGILGGLGRMGTLALLGMEGAWNELARGNTMEYKGDPKRAMENFFAYNKENMNKQAKEAKATSVKQEAEQQAAAQEAAKEQAAQTVAAIQQAQQAYQTPQVGINLASLTPMGGQSPSGVDDLLAMYNMQQNPQGMPNLANFA